MSAVNHVNRVNDVIDVKTPTSAAFGGVSAVRPPTAAFRLSVRLRRRLGGTPPAAAGFSDVIDVIDVIDAVDVIDSGRG
jgi:hypothetical protein